MLAACICDQHGTPLAMHSLFLSLQGHTGAAQEWGASCDHLEAVALSPGLVEKTANLRARCANIDGIIVPCRLQILRLYLLVIVGSFCMNCQLKGLNSCSDAVPLLGSGRRRGGTPTTTRMGLRGCLLMSQAQRQDRSPAHQWRRPQLALLPSPRSIW